MGRRAQRRKLRKPKKINPLTLGRLLKVVSTATMQREATRQFLWLNGYSFKGIKRPTTLSADRFDTLRKRFGIKL